MLLLRKLFQSTLFMSSWLGSNCSPALGSHQPARTVLGAPGTAPCHPHSEDQGSETEGLLRTTKIFLIFTFKSLE